MPWWSRMEDGHASFTDGARGSVRTNIHELAARNAQAAALFSSGNAKDAMELFEGALRDCLAVLGRDHLATLTVAGNLGAARVSAGRRRMGIGLIAANLADRSRVLGGEDPRTLTALDALAVAYRLAGHVDDAVELSVQVAAQRTRVLGKAHPDTLTSRMGMVRAQAAAGDMESATKELHAAMFDAEQALPPRHPHLAALLECAEAIGMIRREG